MDIELTWKDTVENFLIDADKKRPGASNNDKVLTAPKQPKSQKKKHYATLEDTPVKELQEILRSINANLRTTGNKKELIERILRHRPIAPSSNAQADATAPGLADQDMLVNNKKTKRTDAEEPRIAANKRTKREIADLTMETAKFLGNLSASREKKLSSRLNFPKV